MNNIAQEYSRFWWNIVLYSIELDFPTRHMHNWASFLFWPSRFIVSGVISNCPLLFPNSILDTFQPGGLIFQCHIFCLSILSMEFSRQEYLSGLPFPLPVDHILSELFTITCPSWAVLHGIAHSFIELHKPLCHDKAVIHEGVIDYIPIKNKLKKKRNNPKIGVGQQVSYMLNIEGMSVGLCSWFCSSLLLKDSGGWRLHLGMNFHYH